jgi:copper chaperone CopZ
MEIIVENIKCGGCANSIRKKLSDIQGVQNVEVDIEHGKITLDGLSEQDRPSVIKVLADMGYTEPGEGDMLDKAKSYVSCMIGRINA